MTTLKHVVRDILMILISISGIAWLYRHRARRHGPLVRVLCFHDVPDRDWFMSVIKTIATDYHLITPTQFHNQEFHPEKINILLTFDDGYQSWVDVALPVLAEYNATALFFITSGLLDANAAGESVEKKFVRDRLRLTREYQILSWAGARQLVAAGHTIGGHTRTHTSLRQLSDQTEIEKEIIEDKRRLEEMLGIEMKDFAFPFGRKEDISESSLHEIKKLYPFYYSALTGFSKPGLATRTLVDNNVKLHVLSNVVNGSYDSIFILPSL